MVIPPLHKLLNVTLKVHVGDDACTKEIKAISIDLCSRYQSTTVQKLLKAATYLDPRCKSLPFPSSTEKNFVVEDLEDLSVQGAQHAHEDLESSNQPEVKRLIKKKIYQKLQHRLQKSQKNHQTFR